MLPQCLLFWILCSQFIIVRGLLDNNSSEDLCEGKTAALIPQISCSQDSCVQENNSPIEIDISNQASIVICFPQSQKTTISLKNINFKTSETSTEIIFSAQVVSLSSITFSSIDSNLANSLIVQSGSTLSIMSSNLSNFTSVQLISGTSTLNNSSIYSSQLLISSRTGNITSTNLIIRTTESTVLLSQDSINIQQLHLSQTSKSKNNQGASSIIFNSTNSISLLQQSHIYSRIASIQIAAGSLWSQTTQNKSSIYLISLLIGSSSPISITSQDSIYINSSIINGFTIMIANSLFNQASQIFVNDSTLQSASRICKSDCVGDFIKNSRSNCQMPFLYPVISLLADSTTNQFQISQTAIRYKLNQFNDFLSLAATNFTTTIISLTGINLSSSQIISSNIGMYAKQIVIPNDSNLSANELGCLGAHGAGGGIVDIIMRLKLLCGGPGGSHGMVGGSPVSEKEDYFKECFQINAQSTYGNAQYPVYEGSGGGGYYVPPNQDQVDLLETINQTETYGGQGGGFVYIEAVNFNLDGVINVSGGSPQKDYSYLGSGAGGSVQVHAANITGAGTIDANGGSMMSQGGQGGAGRVKINITTWASASSSDLISMSLSNSISVQLRGGDSILTQEQLQTLDQIESPRNGSLISTPCPPGFHPRNSLFVCVQCPPGYFSSSFDLNPCRQCLNNFGLPQMNFSVPDIQTEGQCSFSCSSGYSGKMIDGTKQCLTNMEVFTESIGGDFVIFSLIIGLASILLNVAAFAIYESLKKMKKIKKQNRQQQPVNKTKVRMAIEDLPFHEQRIYIEGENTHVKPWQISREIKEQLQQILLNRGQLKLLLDGTIFRTNPILMNEGDQTANSVNNSVNESVLNATNNNSIAWDPFSRDPSTVQDRQNDSKMKTSNDPLRDLSNSWNIWKEIERACTYSLWEKSMLRISQTVFPFVYYYMGEKYKKKKWKSMKQVISWLLLELKVCGSTLGIKFSCSSCYCQAFIDIVEYSKSELEWDIQSKLPLCLLLQGKGSFMSPFILNHSDPIMALLFTYIKQKSEQINFSEDQQESEFEERAAFGIQDEQYGEISGDQQRLEQNEEIANDLIRLVQCFFNKLNSLSRMICFVSDIKKYKECFMQFVRLISENQDIFELLDLNVQVSIHKINKHSKEKKDQMVQGEFQIKGQQTQRLDDYDGMSPLETDELENSTVTVLPSKIMPGSFGEKQLELELERSYRRKKLLNDFEMKISLVFSREKIYEFDKQYVQEMDSINNQLEWVCYPHKDQVKILLQHTEDHQNFIRSATTMLRHQNQQQQLSQQKPPSAPESQPKQSQDSGSLQFEMLEVVNYDDVSQRQVGTPKRNQSELQMRSPVLSHSSNTINQSLSQGGRSQSRSHQMNRSLQYLDSEEDFKRKLSAMNYTFMYEMLKDHQPIERNSRSLLYCLRYILAQIFLQFFRCKEISQSYRQVDSKVLSNTTFLRIILFLFIPAKILIYWYIHIAPFSAVLLGESSTYNSVFLFIETAIFPFATILCVFYQFIWIIKKDPLSGKMCMILNSMEIISCLIILPLSLPLFILDTTNWMPMASNFTFLVLNILDGFLGSIFLYSIKEKPIILASPNQ